MVKIIAVIDDGFLGEDGFIDATSQVILQIIPDLYLRQAGQEKIIAGDVTQEQVKKLSQRTFPAIRVDYWPSSFGKKYVGKTIVVDFAGSQEKFSHKGLFYRDKDIIFFKRLTNELPLSCHLSLMRDYLKRYGVVLPERKLIPQRVIQTRMDILWHVLQDDYRVLKEKIGKRQSPQFGKQQDPLLALFRDHHRSFWRDLATKISLGILAFTFGVTSLTHYWDRLNRLEEIGRLRSEIVPLTHKQLKMGKSFEKMKIYQQDRPSISFDFAQTIMASWKNHLVITAMEWRIEEGAVVTQYTLLFNPEDEDGIESGAVEQFIDWIESQHPRVEIKEKDIQNGNIRLMVPAL